MAKNIPLPSTIQRRKQTIARRTTTEHQQRKAAADHIRALRERYQNRLFPNRGMSFSRIFLDRDLLGSGRLGKGRLGQAVRKVTGRVPLEMEIDYLKEMGVLGIVAHVGVRIGAAQWINSSKRKEVVQTLRTMAAARAKRFRSLVFATSRYLYANHLRQKSPFFDPHAASAVYDVFGELAKNSNEYKKNYSVTGPLAVTGKKYLRYLIRTQMVSNFRFLKENYSDEKIAALKWGLIGEQIDQLTEQADLERLKFVTSIFGESGEVSLIDRYQKNPHARNMVLRSLIGLQHKARRLERNERAAFYRKVCAYYAIDPREVYEYAKGLANDPAIQRLTGQYLSPEQEQLVETARQAKKVYEFPDTQSPRRKPRAVQPRIQLTPGAQFEIEHGKRQK